jgi:hypothetical protein
MRTKILKTEYILVSNHTIDKKEGTYRFSVIPALSYKIDQELFSIRTAERYAIEKTNQDKNQSRAV